MSSREFTPRSNSQIWRYDNGQWTPLDTLHKPWPEGIELADWLTQDGFEPLLHCFDYGVVVTVYRSRDGMLLAHLTLQDQSIWSIYLADFPSYIGFMREVASLRSWQSSKGAD